MDTWPLQILTYQNKMCMVRIRTTMIFNIWQKWPWYSTKPWGRMCNIQPLDTSKPSAVSCGWQGWGTGILLWGQNIAMWWRLQVPYITILIRQVNIGRGQVRVCSIHILLWYVNILSGQVHIDINSEVGRYFNMHIEHEHIAQYRPEIKPLSIC